MKAFHPLFYILILVLLFQNCGESGENPFATEGSASIAEKANFTWIDENIIQPQCVECHTGSLAFGGLDFTTYNGVMEAVEPGDSENSLLYTRSFSTKFFVLSDSERNIIKAWIDQGAADD